MRTLKTKICKNCNDEKRITEFYYHRKRKHYVETCKECNSKKCHNYQQGKRSEKDIKFILTQRAGQIRRDKKKSDIPVAKNLSKILFKTWNEQKGLCFYSGEPMNPNGYHHDHFACTVDRKIPKLGYVEGNVVLCCGVVNKIKTNLELNELFEWVEKIKKNMQQKTEVAVLS